MKTCIFIPDSCGINFAFLILDRLKRGETRKLTVHLPVGKWLGIARNGMVVGEIVLGKPIIISNKSAEYADSFIAGTEYDLRDGETKCYYPILDVVDMRNDPKPYKRYNQTYGGYE